MNKIVKIIIIVLLIMLIVFVIMGKFDLSYFKTKLIFDNDINETFDRIKVLTDSLDIKIIKSNNDKVNVKIYDRDKNKALVKVENNTLIIENNIKKSNLFFCFGKRQVIISLPEKEYNLLIETTSGDILSKVDFISANINSTSGDIKLNKVNDLNVKITSGDVTVSEVNNITIDSTSGDIEIGKVNDSVNINVTSGDVDINNLTITKESNIKSTSGDVDINKSFNDIYCNTKTISGEVKINNNDRHANYEININTKSGDITVR